MKSGLPRARCSEISQFELNYCLRVCGSLHGRFFNVFVEDGCLLSYGPNVQMLFGNVSYYANRILKAEKPADLLVQQPTKFDLAVNLRTARALGLSVPEAFLALADRVIE